jgi:hypothetical protein
MYGRKLCNFYLMTRARVYKMNSTGGGRFYGIQTTEFDKFLPQSGT